ncbi:LOW QUALITY PROTEIN: potassium channel subfamily K member 18-like [Ctenocephalides felis]|uniref:LOW QUALITY PROTEIN: potassium channel subfamily K member 18-like n=1 Tax=Ctenocephalides felis TaxID=7515 RepID=UPI000E6E542C|nr:LOW QUALITY PROTEIN: potassium channel subfamily K member 18-like [Ctenocephalides felis]
MVYNDNYESSTESCSIGESDDITPAIMEPIIKKNKPEKTKAEIRTTNAVKTSPGKQIKPIKKDSEKSSYILLIRDSRILWKHFKLTHSSECRRIRCLTNKCISDMIAMLIFCGCGGMIFKFTEGAFENFYKCGVKRVKRDFIDQLWQTSMHMREEDWKSQARHKLRAFEEELHTAHEAGMKTYSGQRGWSFLNGVVYCLTVVTTIGYGHISPVTTTGRAITIAYAIIGIPMFLILLADFGKLFTRCIKFVWAFVRRLYYTGSCRKVRRTAPVQEVMKGFNMINDLAHFRRPSQPSGPNMTKTDPELTPSGGMRLSQSAPSGMPQTPYLTTPSAGAETPQTPAPSAFEIDDEFNLPISVAISILLVYIFIGATIYYIWEDWGFFESFYFVFISMSTIGFGDFVPQHPIYMMASIVYLVFGLALTSMCINVVQVKLSDSFRQASAKIGATIGLKMAEEEASAQGTPPEVEIAEVHGSTSKTRNKT